MPIVFEESDDEENTLDADALDDLVDDGGDPQSKVPAREAHAKVPSAGATAVAAPPETPKLLENVKDGAAAAAAPPLPPPPAKAAKAKSVPTAKTVAKPRASRYC